MKIFDEFLAWKYAVNRHSHISIYKYLRVCHTSFVLVSHIFIEFGLNVRDR
jgi:hypothetical protein